MAITLETAGRNAACDAIVDLLNSGTVTTRASTTDLAICTLNATAFGDSGASNPGEAIAGAITGEDSILDDGTADNFQVHTSGAALIFSGSASASGGGGDMIISPNAGLVTGGTFDISSFTVTMPAS